MARRHDPYRATTAGASGHPPNAWVLHIGEAAPLLHSAIREADVLELLAVRGRAASGAAAALVAVPRADSSVQILHADGADVPADAIRGIVLRALRERRIVTDEDGSRVAVPVLDRGPGLAVLVLSFDDAAEAAEAETWLEAFVLPFALAIERLRDPALSTTEQQLLAAIVAGSSDTIFAKDLDGTIRSWNRGAERMYGYSAEEMIGMPVSRLVPPDFENDVPAILRRLRRGERIEQYETVRMTKDGRRLEVSLTISPIREASGRLVGASTIARDVTDRRRLERRSRLLTDLGRALSDTLDEEQALRDLARHLVGGLADLAVTYSLSQNGTIRRVGAAHADPGQQHLAERLLTLAPPAATDAHGAGMVLRTGEPVLVEEITQKLLDETTGGGDYLSAVVALRPVSAMLLPLRARGRTVGALACTTTLLSGRRYTREDLRFASDVADRAALAIDNARLFAASQAELERRERVEAALRVRYEQLRLLYHMTEAVGRATVPDEIYEEAFRALRRYLGNERVAILLWDADDVMRFKAWRGLSDGYRAAVEGHTPWPRDAEDPPPVVIPDVAASPDLDEDLRATILDEGIHALAFIPLVFRHRLLGKFMLYFDEPRTLTSDELEMSQAIAGTVAFAITRMHDEQSVRVARDHAERASQAKSQFLGVMSHELRTPLNAVIGYADLLLMEIRGPLTPGQREQIERMRSSARHQLELIEELLAYTRLEAGREEARLILTDVRRIMSDVAEFVRPEAEMKGIDLRVDLPDGTLEVVTDPAKLRQIILNFASNATKFTRRGAVTLEAWCDGKGIIGEVRDTGPGIPEAKLSYIFEPFAQVEEGRTRPSGGTGLGLAIARRFADMLGGTVTVRSEVGKGSAFRITLPRENAPAGEQDDAEPPGRDADQPIAKQ